MKCEFGYCMLCEKEIAPACGHCGARKPGSQYTEVAVEWSNGSKMNIAVCVDCALKNAHATDHSKAAITKAHHHHWDKQGGMYDKAVVIV